MAPKAGWVLVYSNSAGGRCDGQQQMAGLDGEMEKVKEASPEWDAWIQKSPFGGMCGRGLLGLGLEGDWDWGKRREGYYGESCPREG